MLEAGNTEPHRRTRKLPPHPRGWVFLQGRGLGVLQEKLPFRLKVHKLEKVSIVIGFLKMHASNKLMTRNEMEDTWTSKTFPSVTFQVSWSADWILVCRNISKNWEHPWWQWWFVPLSATRHAGSEGEGQSWALKAVQSWASRRWWKTMACYLNWALKLAVFLNKMLPLPVSLWFWRNCCDWPKATYFYFLHNDLAT